MGLFHSHGAAKFGIASILIGTLHFFEDMALVVAGRYTDVNIGIIIPSCRHPRFPSDLAKKCGSFASNVAALFETSLREQGSAVDFW